jgi:hypothetical protein
VLLPDITRWIGSASRLTGGGVEGVDGVPSRGTRCTTAGPGAVAAAGVAVFDEVLGGVGAEGGAAGGCAPEPRGVAR